MAGELLHTAGDVVNGRYKIVENIGHGAMGEVFVAEDALHPSRKMAVKYLKFAPGRMAALEQFKSEFATLTHLSHPNIAKVYDFEQDAANGQFFFTSELIEGLEFLKAAEGMELEEIEDLFVQSLRALEYLHGSGIFHFDIKSANILVKGNAVKLIDFGLATIRFQGQLVGTPSYMAPEMVRKEDPDGRADLYSLGVLVYSALTGRNPFRAQNIDDTMQNQLKMFVRPPSESNSDVPGYLDTVIMKLLEKRAADRYQTAAEAIRDLNLRSPKKYNIETEETRDSYIPLESKFIGRAAELAKIDDLLSSKRSGMVIVSGKSGSGKTRFLNEVKHAAQLKEWATLFLSDSPRVDDWLDKLQEARNQPTLIGIDDLHILTREPWMPQLEAVAEKITRRLTMRPTVILASSDESSGFFTNVPERDILSLSLSNFTADEIRDYLIALTGLATPPSNLIEQIYTNTGGNPYMVSELIKALVTSGSIVDANGRWKSSTFEDIKINVGKMEVPAGLEERLFKDFDSLPEDARSLAGMMAVLGRPVSANEVACITSCQSSKGPLMMLIRRGLVRYNTKDGLYYFAKPITGGAIYRRMPEAERTKWHDRIAACNTDGEELLCHQSRGSNEETAKEAYQKLIELQIKALRNNEAVQNALDYLKRWDDAKMKLNLVKLYNRMGKYEPAIRNAHAVLTSLKDDTSNEATLQKISALEMIGLAYLRNRNFQEARERFEEALQLTVDLPMHERLRLENFMAEVEFFEGKIDNAIQIYESTARKAEKLPIEQQILVRNNNLGQSYFQKGEFQKAIERLEKDLELYKNDEDRRLLGRMKYIIAESYRRNRQIGKAVATFTELIDYSRSVNDLDHLFRAYNGLGNLYNDSNDYKNALEYYERALDISSRLGLDDHSIACIANIGIISSNTGQMKKASEYFTSALAFLESGKASGGIMDQYHCRMHLELGEICRVQKEFEKAGAHLSEAAEIAKAAGNNEYLFWIRFTQARTASDEGNNEAKKLALKEASTLADTQEKKDKLK